MIEKLSGEWELYNLLIRIALFMHGFEALKMMVVDHILPNYPVNLQQSWPATNMIFWLSCTTVPRA